MNEAELVEKATEKFIKLTGIRIDYNPSDNKKNTSSEIIVQTEPSVDLLVEVKNEIREPQLSGLVDKVTRYQRPAILISGYIPMPVKNILKSRGINYLETAGNCFIHEQQLFIYINDQKVAIERKVNKSQLWNEAGLRFVFAVLYQPEILNQPYRKMAESAKIALGTVGRLLEDLMKEHFVTSGKKDGKKFLFIERKEELMNKWVTMYNTILRPKLVIGNFKAIESTLLDDVTLPAGILWGGEMAGAKLTNYLKPEKQTLYLSIPKTDAQKQLMIVPDINGNIELVNTFWNTALTTDTFFDKDQVAPPIIVYADLLNSHDSRNYETAERIKEKIYGN